MLINSTVDVVEIIADRKEQLGAEIIRRDTAAVNNLAPIISGFLDFIGLFPNMPIAIGSSSRKEKIIRPILEAHDIVGGTILIERFGPLIIEDRQMHGCIKPKSAFFKSFL